MLTERQIYQGVYFSTTSNAIIYSRVIDPETAKTVSKPINTNGNFSGSFYFGYGLKIKKFDVRADFRPSFSYNKSILSINEKMGSAKNLSSGLSVYLSKFKQKQYDISLSNQFSFNRNSTTQNSDIRSFNTNNLNLDIGVYFAEKWKIATDYNLNTRQKTVEFQDNLTNQLWNARVQRTFKNDEFTAYFMIRDILNQNIGIQRNVYENTISQEQNDRLRRYAMIGFTWNFKNKGETKK